MPTIQINQTWRGAMPIIIMGLTDGTPEGKALAQDELMRLAGELDSVIATQEKQITVEVRNEFEGEVMEFTERVNNSSSAICLAQYFLETGYEVKIDGEQQRLKKLGDSYIVSRVS